MVVGGVADTGRMSSEMEDAGLFRMEAINAAGRRLSGSVVLTSSFPTALLTWILVAVVLSLAVLASTASYARKETVTGRLAPSGGLIRLTAQRGGVVERLYVTEGQVVVAGQPVATVRLSPVLSSGDSYAATKGNLEIRRRSAQDSAETARLALEAERSQLLRRRRALGEELSEAQRRAALQERRLALSRAEVERAEAVAAQGFLPGRELELRRSAALQAEQSLSEMKAEALGLHRQIGETDARLAAIPLDLRAAAAAATSTLAGLSEEAIYSEGQANYEVVATVAGRIGALPVARGQVLAQGATLAVLTPSGSPLEAELYAPSRAAGFIREGQEVRLMYQAFPFQKFGVGEGEVASVSRTVLAPADIRADGLNIQEPVFMVRVRLRKDSVEAYGRSIPLQPGMLLTAEVVAERRTLFEWLFDPLYAAGRRT